MAKKPKLLIVADTYYPKVDGTMKFMEEFIKRSADDFEISLLVPDFGIKTKIPGVKEITFIQPSKIIKVSGYPTLKLNFKNRKKIITAIQNADTIFIQGPALISYLSIYYSSKFEKRTIFYVHTIAWELFAKFFPKIFNWFFFNLIKRLSVMMYNRCDTIIVPYHELQTELEAANVTTHTTVAKLGVDIIRFSPTTEKRLYKEKLGIDPKHFVIGYVGRISKEKNVTVLINACKQLSQEKPIHLLLVGDGPKNQTNQCKAHHHCTITGFVDNVPDYLKAMDLFVMPSSTETTSLATLEAMATGLPVIASKVGFIKNYIVKDYNGIFFAKESSAMLAQKIEKIMNNYKLRETLRLNARKTITYSFSWERSISKIKKVLLS